MVHVQFVEHKGKKILHLNFAGCKPDETLEIIRQAKSVIASQPTKSILTLTDVTDTAFNTEVADAMKEFAAHNKPYVIAGAVVGITGLKQIIFNAVLKFSGRHLAALNSVEEAKDWLTRQ